MILKKSSEGSNIARNSDISIIILTKNGERYIDEVLSSLFKQQSKYAFEVIVIDSGSKDNTLSIIKKYPIKLYEIKPN